MNRFKTIVEIESQKEYYQKLHQVIEKEYETKTIYPPKKQIFRALNLCDFDDVKVVILGQILIMNLIKPMDLPFQLPKMCVYHQVL